MASLGILFALGWVVGLSGACADANPELAPDTGIPVASAQLSSTVYLPLVARCPSARVPPFGAQFYGFLDGVELNYAADVGVRWIRVPVIWSRIEPVNTAPEHYDWTSLDASVSEAKQEEMDLILTLAGQPSWAAVYAAGPVTDTADMVEFVGALVERYDGDGFNDAPGSLQVQYFELYNEPDNGDVGHALHGGWGCWGDADDTVPGCGDAESYAELLQALYPAVKNASSQAKLVFGGLALDWFQPDGPFDYRFLDNVLAWCQGKDCFDVMNFHYYAPFRSVWGAYGPGIVGKAAYVRQKLFEYGFEDTPLICTETGWASGADWGSDELQSRYTVKGYVRGLAAELDIIIWYAMYETDPGLPGLLDSDLQPKLSYWAYRRMTTMLGEAHYKRVLTSEETGSEHLVGYVFERDERRLDVVWTEDDTPFDAGDDPWLPLTVQAETLRVLGKFGDERWLDDEDDGVVDGQITIYVGGSPLYLEYYT